MSSSPERFVEHPVHWGYYFSDRGNVECDRPRNGKGDWRVDPRPVKPTVHDRGYRVVVIGGRKYFVHRLVLECFVGPCPEGMEARHVNDNDRANNHLDNLCWGTRVQNQGDRRRHGTHRCGVKCAQAKLTEEQVKTAKQRREAGETFASIGAELGVTPGTIHKLFKGYTWKHLADAPQSPA